MRLRSPILIRLAVRRSGHPLLELRATGGRREVRWRVLDMIMRRLVQLVVHRPIMLQYFSASRRTAVRLASVVQMRSSPAQQVAERELRNVVLRQIVRERLRSSDTPLLEHDGGAEIAVAVARAAVARRDSPAAYPRLNVIMVRAPAAASLARDGAARTTAAFRDDAAAGRASRVFTHSASEPVSLAPQELSRITDHVIRQLDRRVLSYRERTERIL